MEEHPIQQPIDGIVIDMVPESQAAFWVGRAGVTHIEACQKSGLHANLPYVRVWQGDVCLAEFCQHNIVGVYFQKPAPPPSQAEIDRCKAIGIHNHVNGNCTTCEKSEAECDCLPF